MEINEFLTRLAILLAQNRISTRRAAVMAYITGQLLGTLPPSNTNSIPMAKTKSPRSFGTSALNHDPIRNPNHAPRGSPIRNLLRKIISHVSTLRTRLTSAQPHEHFAHIAPASNTDSDILQGICTLSDYFARSPRVL